MVSDQTPATLGRVRRKYMICLVAAMVCLVPWHSPHSDPLLEPVDQNTEFDSNPGAASGSVDADNETPLNELMQSIVRIEVTALTNARTAKTFGSSRAGTGVVIDTSGLIVTTGDIVAEAGTVTVKFHDGRVVDAEVVAYDRKTGLGLVRAAVELPTVAITLGDVSTIKKDEVMMVIPATGEVDAVVVKLGKIEDYSGGWEYIVDNALHTFPPSTKFSGAALVSDSAELIGIGSLVSIDIDIDPKVRVPGNVFIPVETLTSVLGKLLLSGRSDSPTRQPWIGVDVKKTKKGIAVSAVTSGGPAASAGVKNGDILIAVDSKKIDGQSDFFRKLWATYKPGDEVELMLLRGSEYQTVKLIASDYYDWLNKPSATQLSELAE